MKNLNELLLNTGIKTKIIIQKGVDKLKEKKGMSVFLQIVVAAIIVIVLGIIFKDQLKSLFEKLLRPLEGKVNSIYS